MLGNAVIKILLLKEIGFIIGLCGIFLIIKSFLTSKRIKPFRGIQNIFFNLLILTYFIMIVRGYLINYSFIWVRFEGLINYHLIDQYYILPYFLPLFLFIKFDKSDLKLILKTNLFLNLFFIFFIGFSINKIFAEIFLLTSGNFDNQKILITNYLFILFSSTAFFLLLRNYISKKLWLLNVLSFIIFISLAILYGRRASVITGLFLIFGNIIFTKKRIKSKTIKGLIVFLGVSSFIFLVYLIKDNSFFDFLMRDRGFVDNRSNVHDAMLDQMTDIELIFGKGLNGRYYLPLIESDYLDGWRYICETGFYNLVLKGGYFLAVIYILVLLMSVYKGFFKSKNQLSKIFAYYILISILELFPFGLPQFTFKFIFIWFGVMLCHSNYFLSLSDNTIKTFIRNNS